MQNLALVSLFVLLFSSKGCKEKTFDNTAEAKNIKVPAYSETGANNLGFYVNGKPWTIFGEHFETHLLTELKPNILYGSVRKSYSSADSLLYLRGELTVIKNENTLRDEGFHLSIVKNASLLGVHYLSDAYSDNSMQYGDLNYTTTGEYTSSPRNPIKVTINKDAYVGSKRIISGTFEGYLYNNFQRPNADSVHITGGVFDVDISTVAKP